MLSDHIRRDPLNDDIGELLLKINRRKTWTAEVERHRTELCKLLVKRKYIYFRGHPYRYGLTTMTRVGQSYIYAVPLNKRGHLKPYRGKDVRIVVVDSGRYDRGLMAGIYKSKQLKTYNH